MRRSIHLKRSVGRTGLAWNSDSISFGEPESGAVLKVNLKPCDEELKATTRLAWNAYRRAVEAVIWGMPAVNYDLMLQEMASARPAVRPLLLGRRAGLPEAWLNLRV